MHFNTYNQSPVRVSINQDGGVQVLELISSFSSCHDLNHSSLWGDNSPSSEVIKTIIGVPSYHLIILSWKFLEYRIYACNQSFKHLRNISNIVYQVLYLFDIYTDVELSTKTPDDQLASYCVIRRVLRGDPAVDWNGNKSSKPPENQFAPQRTVNLIAFYRDDHNLSFRNSDRHGQINASVLEARFLLRFVAQVAIARRDCHGSPYWSIGFPFNTGYQYPSGFLAR